MTHKTTLETIWYLPDDLWDKVRPLLGREKRVGTVGRPCVPYRTCLDGILDVLRTGCQWKRAPAEFGSGSTLHRRFQLWVRRGVFKRIWRRLLTEDGELRGMRWRWQAIESAATTKAPLGGDETGKSPVASRQVGHQAPSPERSAWRAFRNRGDGCAPGTTRRPCAPRLRASRSSDLLRERQASNI